MLDPHAVTPTEPPCERQKSGSKVPPLSLLPYASEEGQRSAAMGRPSVWLTVAARRGPVIVGPALWQEVLNPNLDNSAEHRLDLCSVDLPA